MKWLAVSFLAAFTACQAGGVDTCDDLHAHLEDCFGSAGDGTCDPEAAEEMLAMSCEQLGDIESKQDGFLCDKLGLLCDQEPIFAEPTGQPTRHPIVLAHGFNGSPENEWGVHPIIVEALRADGHRVFVARVAPFQSVETRAGQLGSFVDEVLEESGAERINLIAHSMGGLDSRFLISSMGYDDRVAALVTLSSPHRGTLLGDAGSGLLPGAFDDAVNALTSAFARTFTEDDLAEGSDLRAALEDIATAAMERFNVDNPDRPGVYYQSWAGVSNVLRIANPRDEPTCRAAGEWLLQDGARDKMSGRLVGGAAIVAGGLDMDPNDGMVTVESAVWGEFMGCIPADHYDEIGQIDSPGFDKRTGYDAGAHLRTIAFDLAARGF